MFIVSHFKTTAACKSTIALISVILVSSCASFPLPAPKRPYIDLDARINTDNGEKSSEVKSNSSEPTNSSADETNDSRRMVYYRGRKGGLNSLNGPGQQSFKASELQLNFANAPAADVARTVVADALGITVAVADGVTGSITLTAPEPVAPREALEALERVLAESDLALLETPAGFLLTTLEDATQSTIRIRGSNSVGYSVNFAEIRNAVPSEISRLIEPFVSDRVTVTADDRHGAIILRGPAVEVNDALVAIEAFDAPFLTDRIFGLFKLKFADADVIRNEVETVLEASSSGAPTTIIALSRMNLVFVVSRTEQEFREARGWIERLDQPSGGDERRLRHHSVQYTPADVLATQLSSIYGGQFYSRNDTSQSNSQSSEQNQSQRRPAFSGSASEDQISIQSDDLNNALLIRATDQEYQEVLSLIEKMDVPSAQVLIEATIAEVTLNDDLSYGVRWFFENAESRVSFPGSNAFGQRFGTIPSALNYSYLDNNVSGALDTLASVTEVTVLSAPSIMVLNNQSASLQVGDEVPIVTQQAQGVTDGSAPIVSTLQLRETGVILEVTPRINASDLVTLEITQEVSDVTPTTTSGIDSPTIQQRRFTSTVAVEDNGTIALGGLIRETYTDSESGIPVLKDIPGLGEAFKNRDITKRRTELIVFLTPRIIRNSQDRRDAFHHIRREMRRLGVADEPEEE